MKFPTKGKPRTELRKLAIREFSDSKKLKNEAIRMRFMRLLRKLIKISLTPRRKTLINMLQQTIEAQWKINLKGSSQQTSLKNILELCKTNRTTLKNWITPSNAPRSDRRDPEHYCEKSYNDEYFKLAFDIPGISGLYTALVDCIFVDGNCANLSEAIAEHYCIFKDGDNHCQEVWNKLRCILRQEPDRLKSSK